MCLWFYILGLKCKSYNRCSELAPVTWLKLVSISLMNHKTGALSPRCFKFSLDTSLHCPKCSLLLPKSIDRVSHNKTSKIQCECLTAQFSTGMIWWVSLTTCCISDWDSCCFALVTSNAHPTDNSSVRCMGVVQRHRIKAWQLHCVLRGTDLLVPISCDQASAGSSWTIECMSLCLWL